MSGTSQKPFFKSTGYYQRDRQPHRELVRPNQITITDFSFCETIFQKKRKRYPLFMLNKRHPKPYKDPNNIFTKEGITIDNQTTSPEAHHEAERKHRSLEKSGSVPKKNLVPFNFVRAKTPKHIAASHRLIEDVPIF